MKHISGRSVLSCILVAALLLAWLPTGAAAADQFPNTWKNTGNQSMDIVQIACSQYGFVEDNGDYVKYNEWFWGTDDHPTAWCSVFISWCAAQAGISEDIIHKNARARGYSVENMDQNPFGGTAFTLDEQTPQMGDILFTRTSSDSNPENQLPAGQSTHCCLVAAVDDTYIYTIEGNIGTPGRVDVMQYNLSDGYEVIDGKTDPDHYIIFATRPDYQNQGTGKQQNSWWFLDVLNRNSYYYAAVNWAAAQEITSGINKVLFRPYDTCTRAQAITLLYRAAGEPEVSGSMPFTDVQQCDYYYNAVLWGYQQGIVSGVDAAHFSPDKEASREAFLTFLWRYEGKPRANGGTSFVDVANGTYYTAAVNWAWHAAVAAGRSRTSFGVGESITRAEAVTFLYRNFKS